MNIWEKLGIAPTVNIAEIKSAYAAMARSCHPEENPEEFQELQKAYKIAVQYAKRSRAAAGQQPKAAGQRPKETGQQSKEAGQRPKETGQQPEAAGQRPEETGQQSKEAGQRPKETGQKPEAYETLPPLWDFKTGQPNPRTGQEPAAREMTKAPQESSQEERKAAREPQQTPGGGRTEIPAEGTQTPDRGRTEIPVEGTQTPDRGRTEIPGEEPQEPAFDFSEIDTFGDKERFFRQFFLIAKNPYIKNKTNVWDVFLNQPSFARLFGDNGFRENVVRTLCGLSGWQRGTILFFDRYLKQFHTDENMPANGIRETGLFCLRRQKRFRIRIPLVEKDVYVSKEGAEIQNRIMAVFHRQNRILDFGNKKDVRDFLTVYFSYAYAHEDQIEFLYRQANNYHAMWMGVLVGAGITAVVFFLLFTDTRINSDRKKDTPDAPLAGTLEEKREMREDYLKWLESQQTEPVMGEDEEKEKEAGKIADNALKQYRAWKNRAESGEYADSPK